ncbi:hypothetical protein Tco_0618543 [Tanacetum coccineum]
MRIDELHKFSDGSLDDVRTALNDRLKGIRMQYLPQTIWKQHDKDNARAMIQSTDKQLKTRRIMRSLEKFVGGRPYEERFYTLAGNPVNDILLKLNLPDHRSILTDLKEQIKMEIEYMFQDFRYFDTVRPSRSDKVLKLKNFKKDASLQLSSYHIKKGMSMSVPKSQVSQDGKDYKMAKRDYAWLMIS